MLSQFNYRNLQPPRKTFTGLSTGNNGHGRPPPRRKAHALSGGEEKPKGPSLPTSPVDTTFGAKLMNLWQSALTEIKDAPVVVVSGLIYAAVQTKGAIDDVEKKQEILRKDQEILRKDQEQKVEILIKDQEILRKDQEQKVEILIKDQEILRKDQEQKMEILKKDQELKVELLIKDKEILKKDQELAALRNQQSLKDALFDLSYQSEYAEWRDKRREAQLLVEKEKLGCLK
ncbi:hypothetical protein CEUSTIGMA_g2651.t1 [Chlamydomonas eustigma]|uniref:Uncharacterized protein n=1 Tax=Chlamydomonas eustigma TaxID=1157962 RepID=A0A250WWJ5_9CHLO|nr:hypothetical protein CEUSTIGMA_g2651.t1 [Chlamydomonas eustigma]|eukprot:GAX75207.1 hypothetical protein CEUSTIGMA_g2651.t1 [Chlamydomonas eustigma]